MKKRNEQEVLFFSLFLPNLIEKLNKKDKEGKSFELLSFLSQTRHKNTTKQNESKKTKNLTFSFVLATT